jgi:hypothetical protein
MKKFLKSKKGLALLAALVVAVAASVGAYAYFTSTGTGSGSASVGNSTNDIVVSSSTTGDMYPLALAPAANTTISVKNNGSGQQYVDTVYLDTTFGGGTGITNSKNTADGGSGTCNDSWFEFDTSPVSIGQNVAAGATYTPASPNATLWLKDNGSDQSACEGATVTVHYLSN